MLALPATLLRRVPITPALPAQQHEAISTLQVRPRHEDAAAVLEALLARDQARPRAFGSPLPFGAIWEGNEEQPGVAGILTLLAGGGASDATQAMVARDGIARFADAARRGSARTTPSSTASRQIVWE